MVTQEAALLLFLLISLSSLIIIHRWFPIYFHSYVDGDGDLGKSTDQQDISMEDESLTCDHLAEITKISVIGEGAVKIVWLAKWRQHLITLSELRDNRYQDDFNHNRLMLQKLSNSGKVVKLHGTCNDTIIMTQFHPLGNPLNLLVWNNLWPSPIITSTIDGLKLCLQFVDLINFLHTHHSGPLVMCDSNTLSKLLSQLLLSIVNPNGDKKNDSLTVDGLQLIFNDLDALPTVQKGKGVKCGPRQLIGTFVAPEQLWPYPDEPFNDNRMPPYNEKIDIWKIPDVCSWFIELSPNGHQLRNSLEPLHSQCKQRDPNLRPNVSTVYQNYLKVLHQQLEQDSKN